MSDRREGWYWVKTVNHASPDYWECSFYDHNGFHEPGVVVVGPRIPSPDEPWQCVLSQPTGAMAEAGEEAFGNPNECSAADCASIYEAMLKAAPSPGQEE